MFSQAGDGTIKKKKKEKKTVLSLGPSQSLARFLRIKANALHYTVQCKILQITSMLCRNFKNTTFSLQNNAMETPLVSFLRRCVSSRQPGRFAGGGWTFGCADWQLVPRQPGAWRPLAGRYWRVKSRVQEQFRAHQFLHGGQVRPHNAVYTLPGLTEAPAAQTSH